MERWQTQLMRHKGLRLWCILGLPGSGKTAWLMRNIARFHHCNIVHMDVLRQCIYGSEWNPEREPEAWREILSFVDVSLTGGRSFVLDESITTFLPAKRLHELAKASFAGISAYFIDTALETCWERRQASGFPQADMQRKIREWDENSKDILGAFDDVTIVTTA